MLKLKDIRKPLPFNMNKNTSVFISLKEVALASEREKYNVELDFDVYLPTKGKNLQRPLIWSLQQKQELILSIFKEINIPSISVIQYKEETGNLSAKIIYKIIDGKQRLSALISYANNEFPIVWEGKEYYLRDLDEWGYRAIMHYTVIGNVAYEYNDKPISDNDKIAWFERINFAGTPQDFEHLKNLKA